MIAALFAGEASSETRTILVDGHNPLTQSEATFATAGAKPAPVPLAQLVGLALGAPEFQRR